jgi:hypothetical protein
MPFGVAKHEDWQPAEEVIHQGLPRNNFWTVDLSQTIQKQRCREPQSGLGRIVGDSEVSVSVKKSVLSGVGKNSWEPSSIHIAATRAKCT